MPAFKINPKCVIDYLSIKKILNLDMQLLIVIKKIKYISYSFKKLIQMIFFYWLDINHFFEEKQG